MRKHKTWADIMRAHERHPRWMMKLQHAYHDRLCFDGNWKFSGPIPPPPPPLPQVKS